MSSPIATALIAELDDEMLRELAQHLAPYLPVAADGSAHEDGWLDSRRAAEYLGLSLDSLHKMTAARAIPFEQEAAGCRLWFKRSELDEWVRAGRPARCRLRAA